MRTLIILLSLILCSCHVDKGIDLSHHNKLTSSDWTQLKSRNIKFVYIKVSEGASYRDPMRFKHYNNAVKHKMHVGTYLFFRDDTPAKSQYFNYVNAEDGMSLDLLPCIDYEKAGFRKDFKTRIKILKELNSLFYKYAGVYPIIYCDLIEYSKLRVLLPNKFWISASSPDLKVGSIKQALGKVNGKVLDFNKGSLKDILFSD
jgi:lysozyme